jgi:NADPH:quinone reductase-like Zn-dependent oxidoreductase
MVVMAIEAAKQLADDNRVLQGYKLHDIHVLTALVIPATSEGIETQMQLHQLRDDSSNSTPSWEFRLYSCTNGQWHKNCQGKIQLDYLKDSNQVDEGRENREKAKNRHEAHTAAMENAEWRRSADQFYDSAWKSGYTFGPALKVMSNITYGELAGPQVTADVKCHEWRSVDNSNHYQEHIVHPATLDGLFQPAVAVYSRAGLDLMATAVPVEIESLWISNNGLSWPNTNLLKSKAHLLNRTKLGYETNVTGLDSSANEVLLDVRGLKLRFLGEIPTTEVDATDAHTAYTIQWKPDIDLLQVMPESKSACNGLSSRYQEEVQQYLELTTFKTPNLKIMHVYNSQDVAHRELLRSLFPDESLSNTQLSYSSYVIAESSGTIPKELESELENHVGISFTSWNVDDVAPSEDVPSESLDLMLAPFTSSIQGILYFAHRALKASGKLILFNDSGQSLTTAARHIEESLAKHIEQGSFARNNMPFLDTEHNDVVVYEKFAQPNLSTTQIPTVLVIEESSTYQYNLATSLQKRLRKANLSSDIHQLGAQEGPDDSVDRAYIFLIELENPLLESLSPKKFSELRQLLVSAKGLLWLTKQDQCGYAHPAMAMIDGLARVLRTENQRAIVINASLEANNVEVQAAEISTLIQKSNFGSINHGYEASYVQSNGQFQIGRMVPSKAISKDIHKRSLPVQARMLPFGECPPMKMAIETPGLIDSIHFIDDASYHTSLAPDEVEIQIRAVGLNFKDVLIALGRVDLKTFGIECAGAISRAGVSSGFAVGERVCILTDSAFASFARVKAEAVARLPDGISFAHAATIPVQFGTTSYTIQHMARLKKDESILIHAGAGGTGQAAIQIAQHLGAEIFVTVSSQEKKQFLITNYGIAEDHIFYSRDTSFADGIMRVTRGRGVDVVLNSLAGESLKASWNIIAPYGRFIELGKKDIDANEDLPMRPFTRGASFQAFEATALTADNPGLVRDVINELLELFLKGILRPVRELRIMPISEVHAGMRTLQEGKMIGKIVFEISPKALVPVSAQSITRAGRRSGSTDLC